MHSPEAQFEEVMRRAGRTRQERRLKKKMLADALAGGICLGVMFLEMAVLPQLSLGNGTEAVMTPYGSLLLSSPFMKVMLMVLPVLCLGILAVLFFRHWKEWKTLE